MIHHRRLHNLNCTKEEATTSSSGIAAFANTPTMVLIPQVSLRSRTRPPWSFLPQVSLRSRTRPPWSSSPSGIAAFANTPTMVLMAASFFVSSLCHMVLAAQSRKANRARRLLLDKVTAVVDSEDGCIKNIESTSMAAFMISFALSIPT